MTAGDALLAGTPDDGLQALPALAAQGLTIRRLCERDMAWLPALYASTREDEMSRLPWPDAMKHGFLAQQCAAQHRHYVAVFADAEFYVVCEGDRPVGRFYLQPTPPLHRIIDIALLPGARGRGVGTALIVASQRRAYAQGCGMELHVFHSNADAARLYARHGFVGVEGDPAASHRLMRWNRPEPS